MGIRYIGTIEHIQETMVCYDEGAGFVTREVSYVPGLFKIFDEISLFLPTYLP